MNRSGSKRVTSAFLMTLLILTIGCSPNQKATSEKNERVLPGIDVLLSLKPDIIKGKQLALITNPTGLTAQFQSTIDALNSHPETHLVALFGPEHGVRGDISAGESVAHFVDEKTGIPVYSLYGEIKSPTAQMLENVEMLLFDIQDAGIRPYTYIYTMALAMQAAKKNKIPFVVLDRPNPLGGELLEGPILEKEYTSSIGLYPIPYIHGMTVGELAKLFNEEFGIHAEVVVIPMLGWSRDMSFAETQLPWAPTSPHVPHATTPFFLAATGGFGELQTLNEGVGYTSPFEYVGAEWIDADLLAKTLNDFNLAGVHFRPAHYTPYYGGKKGLNLHGAQIHIFNYKSFRPIKTQIAILKAVFDLYPNEEIFNPARLDMFYNAIGTDKIKQAIESGESLEEIYKTSQQGMDDFAKIRQKYLLY